MADFRRCLSAFALVAIAVLALLPAANAQQPQNLMTCSVAVPTMPTVRTEGFAELVGDIVLTCTGGTPTAAGTTVATRANITVYLNTNNITSRILNTSNNGSEAALLIDEPGPFPAGGAAPATPIVACSAAASITGATIASGGCLPAGTGPGGTSPFVAAGVPNTYQGVWNFNNLGTQSVTFVNVPIEPPGTTNPTATNGTRIFRITNIRGDATSVTAAGTAFGFSTSANVNAFIQITNAVGPTGISLNTQTVPVAAATSGLTYTIRNSADSSTLSNPPPAFLQCSSVSNSGAPAVWLRYTRNFGSAFKVRALGNAAAQFAGTGGATPASLAAYAEESGTILPSLGSGPVGLSGVASVAGLSDFGTRVKAVFANIPTGVSVWVPVTDEVSGSWLSPTGNTVLVASETAQMIQIPATTKVGGASTANAVPLTLTGGSGTAVWEFVAVPGSNNTDFPIWFSYTAAPNATPPSPATGIGTAAGSFAPLFTKGTALGGQKPEMAGAYLPIPRFIDTSAVTVPVINIVLCRTNLLFPYATSLHQSNGVQWDTGIAIANTSMDPSNNATPNTAPSTTVGQHGHCMLFLYTTTGNTAPTTNPIDMGDIAAGQTAAMSLLSNSAVGANWTGYIFAQCNFQFAHGFAFITNGSNWASGYLALVVPDPLRQIPAIALGGGLGEDLGQ